jgi:hypothetical protein
VEVNPMSLLRNRCVGNKASRPRKQPARSIRLALAPRNGRPGVVDITVGHETIGYFVQPMPSDFGQAFELHKFSPAVAGDADAELYRVNLDGQRSTCECKGFLRHGHCKHVDGLKALVDAGQLLPYTPPTPSLASAPKFRSLGDAMRNGPWFGPEGDIPWGCSCTPDGKEPMCPACEAAFEEMARHYGQGGAAALNVA